MNSSKGSVAKATMTITTETMKLLESVKFEGVIPPLIFEIRTQIPVMAKRKGVQSEMQTAVKGWIVSTISPFTWICVKCCFPSPIQEAQANISTIPT